MPGVDGEHRDRSFQTFFGTALPRWQVQQVTPTFWTWLVQFALILRVICSILRATILV